MILESLVTTTNPDGTVNIAPMGPFFDPQAEQFELRPFEESQTYRNLLTTKSGVLHVTDNVLMFAQAAIHDFDEQPDVVDATKVRGHILVDSCRWLEFNTGYVDSSGHRKSIVCNIVHRGQLREFFGFNRAKHAVIEAAILATRVKFLPIEEIHSQYSSFESLIRKTGGDDEAEAFARLARFVGFYSSGDGLSQAKKTNGAASDQSRTI